MKDYKYFGQLWFDVGIKRYTTQQFNQFSPSGCGLMQESKDIQHSNGKRFFDAVVV